MTTCAAIDRPPCKPTSSHTARTPTGRRSRVAMGVAERNPWIASSLAERVRGAAARICGCDLAIPDHRNPISASTHANSVLSGKRIRPPSQGGHVGFKTQSHLQSITYRFQRFVSPRPVAILVRGNLRCPLSVKSANPMNPANSSPGVQPSRPCWVP